MSYSRAPALAFYILSVFSQSIAPRAVKRPICKKGGFFQPALKRSICKNWFVYKKPIFTYGSLGSLNYPFSHVGIFS